MKSPEIKTTKLEKYRINQIFELLQDTIEYLAFRWEDECQFEDFSDYEAEMKKVLPMDCKFIRSTQSPFGFVVEYNVNKLHYQFGIENDEYFWKRA